MSENAKPIEIQYAELDAQRAALEDQLKACKARLAELEPAVLAHFQQQNVQSLKAGGRTIYLERSLRACKKDAETPAHILHDELREAGFAEYANQAVSWQGLSAFFRERERNGEEPVPKELADHFDVDERFKIRGRKAT